MIRPTKICARTFTRNTTIAIVIIINNNTYYSNNYCPIIPVIPMFRLDVQALDHILHSEFQIKVD